MSDFTKALHLANQVHAAQRDKRGEPYILHPIRVMLMLEGETLRVVALLHDVVEDSALSLQDLREQGFNEEVVQAVDALSRRAGESYFDYVERARQNALAKEVKLADLSDNLAASRQLPDSEENRLRLEKYQKALHIIKAGR